MLPVNRDFLFLVPIFCSHTFFSFISLIQFLLLFIMGNLSQNYHIFSIYLSLRFSRTIVSLYILSNTYCVETIYLSLFSFFRTTVGARLIMRCMTSSCGLPALCVFVASVDPLHTHLRKRTRALS